MARVISSLGAFLICFATVAQVADAHPHLLSAEPAPNSTIAKAPREIRLMFSMPIEAKFSRIRLLDSAGKEIPVRSAFVDPQIPEGARFDLLTTLNSGEYTVNWRVVGIDTHWKAGSYHFRIKQ